MPWKSILNAFKLNLLMHSSMLNWPINVIQSRVLALVASWLSPSHSCSFYLHLKSSTKMRHEQVPSFVAAWHAQTIRRLHLLTAATVESARRQVEPLVIAIFLRSRFNLFVFAMASFTLELEMAADGQPDVFGFTRARIGKQGRCYTSND